MTRRNLWFTCGRTFFDQCMRLPSLPRGPQLNKQNRYYMIWYFKCTWQWHESECQIEAQIQASIYRLTRENEVIYMHNIDKFTRTHDHFTLINPPYHPRNTRELVTFKAFLYTEHKNNIWKTWNKQNHVFEWNSSCRHFWIRVKS